MRNFVQNKQLPVLRTQQPLSYQIPLMRNQQKEVHSSISQMVTL